ncbi:MAG: hypothetical protein ACKOYN_00715 [Planctomycetota bacterium]
MPDAFPVRSLVMTAIRRGGRRKWIGPEAGLAASLAASLALSGCTINRPAVRPIGAVVSATGEGVERLSIELELTNPGSDEIELVEYDYTVRGSDGSGYSGRWAALLALAPESTSRATIPAVVPAGAAGRTWSVDGSLRYRDPKSIARLLYELGLIKPETGFAAADLPLQDGKAR